MDPEESPRPFIGVGVILWKGDTVLLGERLSASDTVWQFPGGHLEHGESVTECALREVLEETGLRVSIRGIVAATDEPEMIDGAHAVTLFVAADWVEGDPVVREPDRCDSWIWYPSDGLPDPLFSPIRQLLERYADLSSACEQVALPADERR